MPFPDMSPTDTVLADFYDAGLHGLDIEADGTIHALAEDPISDRQFKLTVHNPAVGLSVTCMEVNSHPPGVDPFNNRRFEAPIGPVELLADSGLEDWFWRQALSAMLDVHAVAADSIHSASVAAAHEEAMRLTRKWAKAPTPPSPVDVEEAFDAFKDACRRRAPFCQAIGLSWGPSLEGLPGVNFGLAPGAPEQILYEADPGRSKQLYLNGFWTAEHCLEKDLLEHYPDDSWARLGAQKAARDLLEIQRTGAILMESQRAATEEFLVLARSSRRLRTLLGEPGLVDDPGAGGSTGTDRVHQDCVMLFDRISNFLAGLHVAGRATGQAVAEEAH
jgi:hypothetical protein